MKEKVRFIWEDSIRTDIITARKSKIYTKMKERYEEIKEAIETLKRIINLSEKAEEFGVLEVKNSYGYDVYMDWGILKFNVEEIEKATGMDKEVIESKIKENWKEFILELINFEQEQEELMKQYLKEAEPYLTVKVIEDED